MGNQSSPGSIYRASKALVEKATWDFYDQHKPQIKWDLSSSILHLRLGENQPPIHEVTSPSSLNTSLQRWYENIVADSPKTREALSISKLWVDVRDTALAHVEAAGGERIVTASEGHIWQEWLDAANSLSPLPKLFDILPRGFPEITQREGDPEPVYNMITYDQSKQASILGIKFRPKFVTLKDTLEDFSRLGW